MPLMLPRRTLLLASTAAATAAWTHGNSGGGGGGVTNQTLSDSAASADTIVPGRMGGGNVALSDTVATSDSTAGPGVSNIRNAPAWQAGHAYSTLNATATNGGNAYRVIGTGTSASSGGPSGTGSSIVDGTVTWKFSSSADFSSLNSWSAANAGTVAISGGITAQMWNDNQTAYSTNQTVSGITTPDASHGITLTAAPGESFVDKGSSLALGEPSVANGVLITQSATYIDALNVNASFVNITRLQATNTGTGGATGGCHGVSISCPGSSQITVSQNALSCVDFHESAPLNPNGASAFTFNAVNNVLVWPSVATSAGNTRAFFGTHMQGRIESNTCAVPVDRATGHSSNCDFAVGAGYIGPSFTIFNNAFFGFGNVYCYCNTGATTVQAQADGHNATDLASFQVPLNSPPGAICAAATQCTVGIVTSVPYTTATFVQPSNASGNLDLRLVAGSLLLLAANSTGATVTTDIFGTVRPSGRSDIGAHQRST